MNIVTGPSVPRLRSCRLYALFCIDHIEGIGIRSTIKIVALLCCYLPTKIDPKKSVDLFGESIFLLKILKQTFNVTTIF